MALPNPISLPTRRTGVSRLLSPGNRVPLALAAVTLLLGVLVGRDVWLPAASSGAGQPNLYTVAVGAVTSQVTGTGQLVPSQQETLGFRAAGTLSTVDVKSGDHVKAGQVLARQDTTAFNLALQSAQASLAAAEANLANTLNGTALIQAQHALDQARQSLAYSQSQVSTTNANDQSALSADQSTLTADQANLTSDQASSYYQTYTATYQALTNNLSTAQGRYNGDGCSYPPPSSGTCFTDWQALATAQQDLNVLQSGTGALSSASGYAYLNPQVPSLARANQAVGADQGRVNADQSRVNSDQTRVNSDASAGQHTLDLAANAVTNATDAYNNQAVNRPATIAQQQAVVAGAQTAVNTAQQNLDAAQLTAPFDAVITGVSAQAGDTVAAASASAAGAQAPGSTAPLPSSGTTSSSGATGGGGFLTLIADGGLQAVVSFAEADAAKIQSGRAGTLTFDAISGLTTPAHVLAVAASPSITSGVTNYYVTLTLDTIDSRLKSGLTSNATITTASASGALRVPNAAVTRRAAGATGLVTVFKSGKGTLTPVQLGIAGDQYTQVLSGLSAGDQVVLPTRSGTANNRGLQLGGGLGGGGGGLPGGRG